MGKMLCRKIRRLLIPFNLGLLPAEISREVESHLDDCAGCRTELRELMEIGNLLGENRDKLRPPDYGYSLSETIVERAFPERIEPLNLWRWIKRPAVVGLLALGMAIFSYLFGYVNRLGFDNNDIQFYLESYNQVSGVEIVAFGEPEEH